MDIDATALALCIVFPILAILAVAGRFYSLHLKKSKIHLGDWVILAALILSIGNAVNVLYGAIKANLGQHMPLTPQGLAAIGPKLTAIEQMAYASESIVTVAIGLARWLFGIGKFKIPLYIMYTLNGIWTISFTFAYLFQCTPIDHLWTQSGGAQTGCINNDVQLYYAVSSVILDVLVLCMPWPVVWQLHMPTRQKVAVLGILMLGAIVVAVSIGKCWTFFNIESIIESNHDITYDEGPLFYWTVPECCLSVVCACLPTMRPLFHGMSPESIVGSVRGMFSLASLRSRSSRAEDSTFGAQAKGGEISTDISRASDDARGRAWKGADTGVFSVDGGYSMHDLERGDGAIRVQTTLHSTSQRK